MYVWYLDGKEVANETETYSFNYNFTSAGDYEASITISDGIDKIFQIWHLHINNTNRVPIIDSFAPTSNITCNDTTSIMFNITAHDPDVDDVLGYRWHKNGSLLVGFENDSFTYIPLKDEIGYYHIQVDVFDDKGGVVSKEWILNITKSEPGEGPDKNEEPDKDQEKPDKDNDSNNLLVWGIIIIICFIISIILIFLYIRSGRLNEKKVELVVPEDTETTPDEPTGQETEMIEE